MKKSNDNNPQVKEVVDEYIKLNYGDIPADLLGECIQLAKKCNCEEFNEKAEPIYDKYFSYLSTTYIYKEAKEKAKENLERKRCSAATAATPAPRSATTSPGTVPPTPARLP